MKATIIFQSNKGLGAARMLRGCGKGFVLPLDSDNKITLDYIAEGLKVMDQNPDVAVAYANAKYFGEKEGIWAPGPFNQQRLMLSNYIDACALIRKTVLARVGNYDTGMKYMGWEDWDLWLRISFAGYKFMYIDKVLFHYRVLGHSMSKEVYNSYEKPNTLENYVSGKYPDRMGPDWITHIM
jgi:GT2 family glycosyltransferase